MAELHEALARVVLADRELSEVLTEITRIARRAMPSVEAASITLIRGDKPFTAAYDGQMALDADELQYERGYGPCMDAARASQVFLIDDMRSEQRWMMQTPSVECCSEPQPLMCRRPRTEASWGYARPIRSCLMLVGDAGSSGGESRGSGGELA